MCMCVDLQSVTYTHNVKWGKQQKIRKIMSQTHSQDTFIYIIYDDVWDDDYDGIKIS